MARAILQWTEAKDDEGAIERRYTQITQEWPLEDSSKFANTEVVIHMLREACNCLHQGTHLAEKASGGKAAGDRVQELTGTVSAAIEQIRPLNGQLAEISKRADLISAKV